MRVVAIDDNEEALQLITLILTALGCEALSTPDPREGLALIERERPDVVLVDAVMPDMSGADVLAWMDRQPHLRHIPTVMMMSGEGTLLARVQYLFKPFGPRMLAVVLRPYADSDVLGVMEDFIAGRVDLERLPPALQDRRRVSDSQE